MCFSLGIVLRGSLSSHWSDRAALLIIFSDTNRSSRITSLPRGECAVCRLPVGGDLPSADVEPASSAYAEVSRPCNRMSSDRMAQPQTGTIAHRAHNAAWMERYPRE